MQLLKDAHASFDFRDKHYTHHRQNGTYRYERHFTNEAGEKVLDVLNNRGFQRFINVDTPTVDDKSEGLR